VKARSVLRAALRVPAGVYSDATLADLRRAADIEHAVAEAKLAQKAIGQKELQARRHAIAKRIARRRHCRGWFIAQRRADGMTFARIAALTGRSVERARQELAHYQRIQRITFARHLGSTAAPLEPSEVLPATAFCIAVEDWLENRRQWDQAFADRKKPFPEAPVWPPSRARAARKLLEQQEAERVRVAERIAAEGERVREREAAARRDFEHYWEIVAARYGKLLWIAAGLWDESRTVRDILGLVLATARITEPQAQVLRSIVLASRGLEPAPTTPTTTTENP
jgi:hypothetical protein